MNNTIMIVLMAILLCFCAAGGTSFAADMGKELKLQPQSGPSLKATQDWLTEQIETTVIIYTTIGQSDGEVMEWKHKYADVQWMSGCKFSLRKIDDARAIKPKGNDYHDEHALIFSIADNDEIEVSETSEFELGQQLKVDPPYYWVKGGVAIMASDRAAAERIAKALRHAAKLCGSQSKKDLF